MEEVVKRAVNSRQGHCEPLLHFASEALYMFTKDSSCLANHLPEPDVYIINIKPHNWATCRQRSIYGIRHDAPTPFSEGRWKSGDICLVRVSGAEYGVRAIWYIDAERPIKSGEEVPWTDADYDWLIQLKPLVEFKEPFSEKFEGTSKYSDKVKMNSIRIVQSVVKLTPPEIRNYFEALRQEKRAELEVEVIYLESKIHLDSLLAGIMKQSTVQIKTQPVEQEERVQLEDVVGEAINFRGMVYAPMNEAGVILLFSKVMDELGLLYESTPTRFPDMIGRLRLNAVLSDGSSSSSSIAATSRLIIILNRCKKEHDVT